MIRKHLALLLLLTTAVFIHSCQDDPILPAGPGEEDDNIVKSKVYITAIQINDYPPFDPDGNLWDTVDSSVFDYFGHPDIFFNISDPDPAGPIYWSQQSHFNNVPPQQPTAYYLTQPLQITPIGTNINVNIYDYELPDSTLMGTVSFFIGENSGSPRYPTELISTNNGYSVSIGLDWEE